MKQTVFSLPHESHILFCRLVSKVNRATVKRNNNGFSKLEFLVVVILISIIGAVVLNRMWSWRYEVERTHILTVVSNIRSVLGLQTAELASRGQLSQLPRLAGSNPFTLLKKTPKSYLGELSKDDPKTQQPGIWYFDRQTKILTYTIKYSENFRSTLKGQPRVRFMIQLSYSDNNRNRRYDAGTDGISGLNFISLDKYHWESSNKTTKTIK